jgi:hypothetical protein
MTPPTWLDAARRRRPTRACWTCGREVAPMRFRPADLRPHGWQPGQTLHIPDWCGCSTEYIPVPVGRDLVGHGADLGPRADAESATPLGTARPVLGA